MLVPQYPTGEQWVNWPRQTETIPPMKFPKAVLYPAYETEPVIDTSIPDNSGNSAVIIIIAVIAVVGIGAAVIVLTGRKKSMKNK